MLVAGAFSRGDAGIWFDFPFAILGFRGFGIVLPALVITSCAGLPIICIHMLSGSARPFTLVLFLVTLGIGFVRFILDRSEISALYRHAQPLVGLMLLFAVAAVLEVCCRGLVKEHLLPAVAAVAIAVAYWFVILIVTASS
jgi:hypothetical protein